jgi:ribosomal protein L37AE/L43A
MSKKTPKANSKLQNNKAIREMLDGTHHTQTRKSISTHVGNKQEQKREVGSRWTDANGVSWEQKDGYRVKNVDRSDRIKSINEYLNVKQDCPNCNKPMTKRLDTKYYNIHKMCMDCSIDLEHKMRLNGTWKEYERKRILENIKAWLKDAEAEKEILKREISNDSYVNGDGTLEKWELPYNVEEQCKRIDEGFVKFKQELLTKYEATDHEINDIGVVNGEHNEKNS